MAMMTLAQAQAYATELFVEAVNQQLAESSITVAELRAITPTIREQHAELMRSVDAQFERRRSTLH